MGRTVFHAGQCPQVASTDGADRQQYHRPGNPEGTARPAEHFSGQFYQDEKRNHRRQIREDDEDGAQCELRQTPEQQPARDQAQRHQRDGRSEPGKSSGAVPAKQNDEQNEVGREGQRPENLDRGEIKIQVHAVLT